MCDGAAKILILVEGEKTDLRVMERLLQKYGISKRHEIVPYKTDIYDLYDCMFVNTEPQDMDLLQVLKERERSEDKRKIFDDNYSDIILIFDLDPQASRYSAQKILQMTEYFVESSDMGKLYINYPCVEAFYHMSSIPDPQYCERVVTLKELKLGKYKERVNNETKNSDYRKFTITKDDYDKVICANIEKAQKITCGKAYPKAEEILAVQLNKLKEESCIYVLCTCIFYIYDYNPALIS